MNHALQSHTPTAHPLNYDALATREGCEDQTGNDFAGVLGFTQLCVFSHSASLYRFNQPGTVSYQVGPTATAHRPPHLTGWVAWVATAGVRIGILGRVTPPANTLGVMDSLFPDTLTAKLTHCFDSAGLLHIAIEKATPDFIQLRRYTDSAGTIADISFAGRQPMLFNAGLVQAKAGVVCYYVRSEQPFRLYARHAVDNFAVERLAMPDLRVNVVKLLSIRSLGDLVKLYGLDDLGRDVTMTSPHYAQPVASRTTLGALFVSGTMFSITTPTVPADDKAKIGASFVKGQMFDGTAETVAIPADKAKVGSSFESGEMNLMPT